MKVAGVKVKPVENACIQLIVLCIYIVGSSNTMHHLYLFIELILLTSSRKPFIWNIRHLDTSIHFASFHLYIDFYDL